VQLNQDLGTHWHLTVALARRCGLRIKQVPENGIPKYCIASYLRDVGYDPKTKTIYCHQNGEVFLTALHEVCHWLAATPEEREEVNWGYERTKPPFVSDEREDDACIYTVGLAYAWGAAEDAESLHHEMNVNPADGSLEELAERALAAVEDTKDN
jgi:hypothetical protein